MGIGRTEGMKRTDLMNECSFNRITDMHYREVNIPVKKILGEKRGSHFRGFIGKPRRMGIYF